MKSEPAARGELCRKGFKSSGTSADYQRDNHGYCDYINFGDTYDTTIVHFESRFFVGCWGDIAERY
jgi:hypothetical protein